MTFIAKSDACAARWQQVLVQVAAHLRDCAAHPARSVVLLPYAQLMPWAGRYWALHQPDGFAPRFETTRNWADRLAAFEPQAMDLTQDAARDLLTARTLLVQAGLAAHQDVLAVPLQEAAQQLAGVVAAQPPAARAEWAQAARALLVPVDAQSPLHLEAAVARIALEWAVASRYATDVLFEPSVRAGVDALVVLQGFQPDPLAQALLVQWQERGYALSLAASQGGRDVGLPQMALHAASDAEDEAQRAAACVIAHCRAGRWPVALAATDRALVRRVRAHLDSQGLAVRDESGWILSTTRAAAEVMACLRASAWNASSDQVLDWLKHAPALPAASCAALERWMRRQGQSQWSVLADKPQAGVPAVAVAIQQAQTWRESLRAPRTLVQWLEALRGVLEATGQWPRLQADDAGMQVLAALRLADGLQAELHGWHAADRTMAATDFARWVDDVLEAARYVPAQQGDAPVVILPLPQLLARPFAAAVLPGCDEKRLQPAPEPPGAWTAAQRQAWGLPTREALERAQRAAWAAALEVEPVDVLWRTSDEGGEPLLPSALVQALHIEGRGQPGNDARVQRSLQPQPTQPPQPSGALLLPRQLSSSAYEDLRRCPYRFFALRQLGLQESDELDADVDKRDFGNWLHAVLEHFHEQRQAAPSMAASADARAQLDASARAITEIQGLQGGDFLPFEAGWPQLRDGYLHWLAQHEAAGGAFDRAEVRARQALAEVELVGVIDRIDHAAGATLLIDYKTESDAVTRARIQAGAEDTQLAFYAALLPGEALRAAYLNVGERGETRMHEQPDLPALRVALEQGIVHDMQRIAQGEPLPALGEGRVCDHCAARGLCRKDFWND